MRLIIIAPLAFIIVLAIVAFSFSSAIAESNRIYDSYYGTLEMKNDVEAQLESSLGDHLSNYTTIPSFLKGLLEPTDKTFRIVYDPFDILPFTYSEDFIPTITGKEMYVVTGIDVVDGYHLARLTTLYDLVPYIQSLHPNESVVIGASVRENVVVLFYGRSFNYTNDELIDFFVDARGPIPNATPEHREAVRSAFIYVAI